MREATAARYAVFKQVMQDRSCMKWAYPLWNEFLCIIIPVEINTWLYVAWLDLAPYNGAPPQPSHSVLYEFSKLTCCRLGYLQCPVNYVFVMSRNSKLCSW